MAQSLFHYRFYNARALLVKKGVAFMVGVVYKITNNLNGKGYVGQTTRPVEERFRGHINGTLFVDREIQKYGVENFSLEVLEVCETVPQLREREIFWMVEENTIYPNGYNLNDGMDNVSTFTPVLKNYATPTEPVSIVKNIVGRKWKWELLWFLYNNGSTRYNELKRRIPGITNIMLTKSLRELEADGLVERRELVSAPPKIVEYSLTPLGMELIPALNELYAWGRKVLRGSNVTLHPADAPQAHEKFQPVTAH